VRAPTAGPGPVSIRDYTAEDEGAWLDCWGRLTVTSHAWGLPAYQSKPRYARAAVELVTVPVAAASTSVLSMSKSKTSRANSA